VSTTAGVRGVDTGRDDGPWTGAVTRGGGHVQWSPRPVNTVLQVDTSRGREPYTLAGFTGLGHGTCSRAVVIVQQCQFLGGLGSPPW